MELKENKIYLTEEERQKPKLMTGTRVGAILGFNAYSTPFQAFCEITHTWESPFEDTIYTLAGKAIEPKQAAYVATKYPELNVVYPKDLFGEDYFSVTHGNFFTDDKFGGMWDYLGKVGEDTVCVFEMKTAGVSKKKDWAGEKKIPESYALQASLYAWLLGVDTVRMVATFLNQKNGDYEHPEDFEVTDENTLIKEFKVSERYPNFEAEYIKPAVQWWNDHILTGISPEWDAIRDAEILEDLKKRSLLTNATASTITVDTSMLDVYTSDLDQMINAINTEVLGTTTPNFFNAKRYYMQLPLLLYQTSCTIQALGNKELYDMYKLKADNAKLIADMLEKVVLNPNMFRQPLYS